MALSREAREAKAKLPPVAMDTGASEPTGDRDLDQPNRGGPATPTNTASPRVAVDVDTFILRPDLGPTSKTFVAAGEKIPVGLEGYDREPAP